jgi:hypothetical protein
VTLLGIARRTLEALGVTVDSLTVEQQRQPFGVVRILGSVLRLQLDKGVGQLNRDYLVGRPVDHLQRRVGVIDTAFPGQIKLREAAVAVAVWMRLWPPRFRAAPADAGSAAQTAPRRPGRPVATTLSQARHAQRMQFPAVVALPLRLIANFRLDIPPALGRSTSRILRMGNLRRGMSSSY